MKVKITEDEIKAPEAPIHYNNEESFAWKSGWENGYEAAQKSEQLTPVDGKSKEEILKHHLGYWNYKDLPDLVHNWIYAAMEEYKNQPTPTPLEAGKPKVVCFCGSTRFAEWFMIKRWELEKQGIITFGINILPNNYFAEGNSHGAEQEGVKHILDDLHKRKIDLSDEVFVLNVGGYIGESTRNEIDYAIEIGKPIKYLES